MAIMRKRALFDDVEHVTEMIKAYRNVVKKLLPPEVNLISIMLDKKPGIMAFIIFRVNTMRNLSLLP